MPTQVKTEAERELIRQRSREWRMVPGNKERERETKRRFREANPETWRAQRLAASRRYNDAHREQIRAKACAVREQLRNEVITAYGCRCACPGCHVHHAELLTVDHVHGGARHRQNRRSTRDVYRTIKQQGFPPEFQLLCGSCNLAKSAGPACPLAGQEH